jgi:poly(A) polymerase
MIEPLVVTRAEHAISRRDIDPDALKVLYRLRQFGHTAYLVGGSVRDLLLGRHPKDFDIGTSAHPYEVKRLFRNCWIIGRRFRLAHVKFGAKTIEVATFRRSVHELVSGESVEADQVPPALFLGPAAAPEGGPAASVGTTLARDLLIRRDNTFGTPEEDAFRRDFTVNALFYDIGSYSVIDYVGGLGDLRDRLVRCIGDPDERFREDPVRMLRAIALAARLDFQIDPPVHAAIARHRSEITKSAPPRLLEEFYKILRSGAAERTFRGLHESGLLRHLSPELHDSAGRSALWTSLGALDAYRGRFQPAPAELTNPVLLGSLLVPLGFSWLRSARSEGERGRRRSEGKREQRPPDQDRAEPSAPAEATQRLGVLPIARRDVERLRQILAVQDRMARPPETPRASAGLLRRPAFREALTWLEIHGNQPEAVAVWRAMLNAPPADSREATAHGPRYRRRRRRWHGTRRTA